MSAIQIITRKRDGIELSEQEIKFLVEGYVSDEIPDYQIAAFLMATYFQGMSFDETYFLTKAMIDSGSAVDFSNLGAIPVDKHSTGGVGDKISLILAPLVASAGVPVPMMSGRGLGHSGGTLDKLEAIPGFRTRLSLSEFKTQIEKIGVAMIGQTQEIVPADQKIYALRDSSGTVASIPLVVASIMSKKIAEGVKALVLDVKTGKGAFFTSKEKSLALAKRLIAIGDKFDLETTALMTAMDQPLGYAVGNWLETKESIETLKGEGPEDVVELTLALGAEMLYQARIVEDVSTGLRKLKELLDSGAAYNKFLTLVQEQGGDISLVENPEKYPKSRFHHFILSQKNGFITSIDALKVGLLAMEIGAGRKKISDPIDYTAGIILRKKNGDQVNIGDPLFELHYSKAISKDSLQQQVDELVTIGEDYSEEAPLILSYINKKGQQRWPHK
jgi:pyrimidine-nucleoside phosphorylase